MFCSIIISSYNQGRSISKILKTLETQIQKMNLEAEVIIADDGSNLKNIKLILDQIKKSSIVCKLTTQQDTGFRLAESRNNALALAQGKIIVFIDGDCIPDANFIEAHITNHKNKQNTILIGHRAYVAPIIILPKEKEKIKWIEQAERYTIEGTLNSSTPWAAVWGRNFSIKLSNKHFFDSKIIGWGGEDIDFAINIYRESRCTIKFIPEAIVFQNAKSVNNIDPLNRLNNITLCCTYINHLYIMFKNKDDKTIFTKLASILWYYVFPYDYINYQYVLNKQKKEQMQQEILNKSFTFSDAIKLYNNCLLQLEYHIAHHKYNRLHPALTELAHL